VVNAREFLSVKHSAGQRKREVRAYPMTIDARPMVESTVSQLGYYRKEGVKQLVINVGASIGM
jgi:hypothetical protein